MPKKIRNPWAEIPVRWHQGGQCGGDNPFLYIEGKDWQIYLPDPEVDPNMKYAVYMDGVGEDPMFFSTVEDAINFSWEN